MVIGTTLSVVCVAPACAWDLIAGDGTTGAYTIDDMQAGPYGAGCQYADGSIQRDTPSMDPDTYRTFSVSPTRFARANDTDALHSWPIWDVRRPR